MKKLLIFLFFLPFCSYAQLKFGLKGGVNIATIESKSPHKPLLRFNLGTTMQIPLDEKWFIYTGPYYSGKGTIMSRSFTTGKIDSFRIHLNYIELPLNVGYRFSEGTEKGVGALFGPYLAYGFNGKITVRNSNSVSEHLHRKDHIYKRLDFGLNAAIFYQLSAQYGLSIGVARSLLHIERDKPGSEKNFVVVVSFFWYL